MFHLSIYSIEKTLFEGEADQVQVPGRDGELGILSHHIPLITALGKGKVRVRRGEEERVYEIGGGFLEVRPNRVTVLIGGTANEAEVQ